MRRGILFGGLGLLLALSVSPALAQTTTTYQPGGCSGSTNLGSASPGQTISGTLGPGCDFAGHTVAMTVNGASGGPKTANQSGGVPVSLVVTSTSSGQLNDPVTVPLKVGTNTISATGLNRAGQSVTVSGTFTVVAPQTATTNAPSSSGGGAASRVAFTGANILRWSLAAAALLGIGALMVWGSRRKRSTLER